MSLHLDRRRTSLSSTSSALSDRAAFDLAPASRRSSSESSATLLDPATVTATVSKATFLSPSSSAQSAISFSTSASSTSRPAPGPLVQGNVSLHRTGDRPSSAQSIPSTPSTPPPDVQDHGSNPTKDIRPLSSSSSSVSPSTTPFGSASLPPLRFGDFLFPDSPTIQDLHQVYLLDRSSKQRDFRQSLQLHAHLMGLSLSARVSRGLDQAFEHVHDAFKNRQRPDQRSEFTSSFNYTYDETERVLHHALANPHPRPSFLDMMNPASSTAILSFLHLIRTDPSILATAFRNLHSPELDTLLLPERPSAIGQPHSHLGVRGARERGQSMHSGQGYPAAQAATQTQTSTSQKRAWLSQGGVVPNFINNQDIVHIILNNLFGPSSFEREHSLRLRTLQAIFVNLLTDKKGERLMTEILDRFVTQSEWQHSSKAKGTFEKTLLDLIRRGEMTFAGYTDEELNANTLPQSQVLGSNNHSQVHHHHHHQSLGKMTSVPAMRVEQSEPLLHHLGTSRTKDSFEISAANADQQPRIYSDLPDRQAVVEEYFTLACLDILGTLEEFTPPCLIELSRLIFSELDDSSRSYASLIIIVKFFFYRFMNKCIAYPETYGMVQDSFITERQRQRILFTTHQRLYRFVTGILNPVPGWESRTSVIDPRIREKVEHFISLFTMFPTTTAPTHTPAGLYTMQHTLYPITDSSSPAPEQRWRHASAANNARIPATAPVLLLCPSDFTTLFYFVCPNLRSPGFNTPHSLLSSSALMTRSSSFSGKSSVTTRQRTSSETPPTYPAATKATSSTSPAGVTASSTTNTRTSAGRTHKRASPSFSFFTGSGSSVPFRSKPPAPSAVEKSAESATSNLSMLSLSGIRPGFTTIQPAAPTDAVHTSPTRTASGSSRVQNIPITDTPIRSTSPTSSPPVAPTPTVQHWKDDALVPTLVAAVQEIKNFRPGPIKEAPWVLNHPIIAPLREAWALVYVQYEVKAPKSQGSSNQASDKLKSSGAEPSSDDASQEIVQDGVVIEVGLTLAPSCMAMAMENSNAGGRPRIVTVTKPMLVDQVVDSAGDRDDFSQGMVVDLDVEESDTDSVLSSEDSALSQRPCCLTAEDKEMSILRVNSSQMLSCIDDSGTTTIPTPGVRGTNGRHPRDCSVRSRNQGSAATLSKKKAADLAWKTRIRQTVHSELDLPEEIRTVARSIFKILKEFDVLTGGIHGQRESTTGDRAVLGGDHSYIRNLLLLGIEEARQFGNHASAIGFHHSLRVLESSPLLRQLDSSKILYLLAMPIKHRLEHRANRARTRTMWEGFAHTWHARLIAAIDRKREGLSSLRIKMYYQTCVRTSRAFEKSLGVVGVLSRMNKSLLRRHAAMEEWEREQHQGMGQSSFSTDVRSNRLSVDVPSDGSYVSTPYGSYAEGTGPSQVETTSRRHSGNAYGGSRPNKARRSSFSAYIDNMTTRSFGSHSFLENGLGNLKEKEQANFSNSTSTNNQGVSSGQNHGGAGSSFGEPTAIQSDFTMDAREIEAVQRWVQETGIHNFLPGEDNFHRFCMEIESVVRGIGLGGTGIQGAGIQQTQNGSILPSLSSSGGDFFAKEVVKFNGQFVPGMGPDDPIVQAKSGSASGVAEFLVNSFKNGHSGSSAPASSGGQFSNASNGSNQTLGYAPTGSASSDAQPLSGSAGGMGPQGRSKFMLRQTASIQQQVAPEAFPPLADHPSSIYASDPGPTYALYNPPYSTASHGASTSYSSSTAPGGLSSTISPHQTMQLPKDMPEFLRRIQLKLTSFLLSEWLDMFGEVETDRWFAEFLEEMINSISDSLHPVGSQSEHGPFVDSNQDGGLLSENSVDMDSKSISSRKSSRRADGVALENDYLGTRGTSQSQSCASLSSVGAMDSVHDWEDQRSQGSGVRRDPSDQGDRISETPMPVTGAEGIPFKSLKSKPSIFSVHSAASSNDTPWNQDTGDKCRAEGEDSSSTGLLKKGSRKSLLNIQVKNLSSEKASTIQAATLNDSAITKPYDLSEAYQSTIELFNQFKSPYQKLGQLFALELLIVASLSYPDSCRMLSGRQSNPASRLNSSGEQDLSPRALTPGTDAIVNEIEQLFRHPGCVRPRNLLRDMQLIATFIPGSILDLRDDGKAFWDMALAVTSLKTDVVEYIVERGTRFVEADENGLSRQETDKSGSRAIMRDDEERVRMSEAVRLFTIGAKESHPVAQRELAILYMSLPMLPSTSSPPTTFTRVDGSPLMGSTSRVPSPISISTSMFGKQGKSTPPPSPKGILSGSFIGKGVSASIPIKQRPRHQHSSSGSGSSFGSGVLSGLGIMTGLGSFTGSSSGSMTGSGSDSFAMGSGTVSAALPLGASVHAQAEFAEGHDIEQYLDMQAGRPGAGADASSHQSLHPHHPRQHHHHPHHHYHPHHRAGQNLASSGPDKFNPENVAAAMHWFTLAAAQGDKFSINYLKHKETAGGMLGG